MADMVFSGMKMKKRFFVFFLVFLSILVMIGCQRESGGRAGVGSSDGSVAQSPLGGGTEQKILTFSLSGYSDSGKRSWDVKGDSADILTTNVILLDNVLSHSYTKGNAITLTADKGRFDKTKNNLLLEGNVVGITDDGARLTTDSLNWNAQKEEVDTDDLVIITRENMEARGHGAFGQPDLKRVQLKKDVTVNLKPTTVITCDGPFQVDALNNVGVFNKNVLVVDERGKIWADTIEVYFDSKTKTVIKVAAKGNVKIERGDNVTYSDQATYNAKSKLIILSGRPKLILYSKGDLDAITGD